MAEKKPNRTGTRFALQNGFSYIVSVFATKYLHVKYNIATTPFKLKHVWISMPNRNSVCNYVSMSWSQLIYDSKMTQVCNNCQRIQLGVNNM